MMVCQLPFGMMITPITKDAVAHGLEGIKTRRDGSRIRHLREDREFPTRHTKETPGTCVCAAIPPLNVWRCGPEGCWLATTLMSVEVTGKELLLRVHQV